MAQFHRFRLADFAQPTVSKSAEDISANAAGICSRFRVSDFVPWDTASSPKPVVGAAEQGQFFVDLAKPLPKGPDKQDDDVSATILRGMGMGKLVVGNKRPRTAESPAKRTISSMSNQRQNGSAEDQPPPPPRPPAPVSVDPHVVEWNRIVNILATIPPEAIVYKLDEALRFRPQNDPGSLLANLGEIFPPPSTNSSNPSSAPSSSQSRKLLPAPPRNSTSSAPITRQAPTVSPPPPHLANTVTLLGKTCARCNSIIPTDASHESATCRIPHPYAAFEEGLTIVGHPRKSNDYKTTWKWRCCGRTVSSSSRQLETWPRKEDDTTQGWCFFGDHTKDSIKKKAGKGKSEPAAIDLEAEEGASSTDPTEQDDAVSEESSSGTATTKTNKAVVEVRMSEPPRKKGPLPKDTTIMKPYRQYDPLATKARKRKAGGVLIDLNVHPNPPKIAYQFSISRPVVNGEGSSAIMQNTTQKRKRGRPKGSISRYNKRDLTSALVKNKKAPVAAEEVEEEEEQQQQDDEDEEQLDKAVEEHEQPTGPDEHSWEDAVEEDTPDAQLLAMNSAALMAIEETPMVTPRKRGRPRGSNYKRVKA